MALIYTPKIFRQFPEVRSALTLRGTSNLPYGFNMSTSVGDDPERVAENRKALATKLGFTPDRLAFQNQVHGDAIAGVGSGYIPGESDALVTTETGWLLAISVADCVPILLYDAQNRVIAGVHSGWRGSRRAIATKALWHLRKEYGTAMSDLYCYIGASAGRSSYEVGEEVAEQFDDRYSTPLGNGKYLLDNKGVVLDQVRAEGVPAGQIEVDARCTISDTRFHSYRRDGAASGRMFAVIGLIMGETA